MRRCSDCSREKRLIALGKCKSCYTRDYKNKNSAYAESEIKRSKEWRDKNKKRVYEYFKLYRANNKEKFASYKKRDKERQNEYQKNRLKVDPKFRAIANARTRVRMFLKRKQKLSKSLGCSHSDFVCHIESLFTEGMSWENYGEWHIDHIFPLSVAYSIGEEQFKKACNYKNLQPLWARENIQKGAKV